MAARRGQKVKLLYLLDILRRESDEEHPLNAVQLCDRLASVGVTAERKAVYDDIEQLIDFGYDIIKTRVPRAGFFLASREFEIPEIYLLGDAVRTAKFISAKKTRELTAKLDGLLSTYQAARREKGVYFDPAAKTDNEEIYYTVDRLAQAIENRHKIVLKYGVRTLGEGRTIERRFTERKISPYALTWQDDCYYLIGNYEKYNDLIHLRIDRMRSVTETDEPIRPFSEVSEYRDTFDVADYTKRLFRMHSGTAETVELRCRREILEPVADRFSQDIFLRDVTETGFSIVTKAIVSEALVTWIMNYGDKMEVIGPSSLRKRVADRAEKILALYANDGNK